MRMLIVDQLNNQHFFNQTPRKIVSLVPSITETLFDFGLENSIVGITKFCVNPPHFKKTKTIVGGTKKVNFDKIKSLNPDIIFCNKEENTREMVTELQKISKVWLTNIVTLADNNQMITDIGQIFSKPEIATNFINQIGQKSIQFQSNIQSKKAAYIIWKNPYMAAGFDTYISAVMQFIGLKNTFEDTNRYPETSVNMLQQMNLDFLLLSSEPYPFSEKDCSELQTLLPSTKVMLVDGEMFSWHGTRLLRAIDYFEKIKF
jgi:ABC-type Fe3+-hydroxamate transport system substrate-binding protein